MRKYNSCELAVILNGKLFAKEDIVISGIGDLKNAHKGDVVCLHKSNINEKFLPEASLFITDEKSTIQSIPKIIVNNTQNAFISLLNIFNPYNKNGVKEYISPTACIQKGVKTGKNCFIYNNVYISQNVKIGNNNKIYPNVYIGEDVEIGNNVTIKPNAVIENGVKIGNNVTIHSGSVIGSDGFGYFEINGERKKIPQIGNVIIEDDVEIGSNVCIDRATINHTLIKKGTKIDNLVQIGHNTTIGQNSVIVSQAGISGSCKIGNNCIIAGQAGLSDHVSLNDGTIVLSKTGVSKSFNEKNQILFGIPAKEAKSMWRILAAMNKLPDIIKKVNKIDKNIKISKENK